MAVTLRPWKTDDLERLVYIANDERIPAFLTDSFPSPYTYQDGQSFLETALLAPFPLMLAIESNGWLAGGIGVHPRNDIYRLNAELGYWLGCDFWGYGIATEAIRQMVSYTFSHTEITRIFATPFPHNIASIRALEKNGFFLEARFEKTLIKHGHLMDELVYAIRRSEIPFY